MPGSLSVTGIADTSELHVLHATSGNSHFNWTNLGQNFITHKTGAFTRIRSFDGVSAYTTVGEWDDTGLTFHDSGGTAQGTISQTSSDMRFNSGQHIYLNPGTGHFSYTFRSGTAGQFRAYGNAGINYIRIMHDDSNGLVDASGGNLLLARGSITKMTVGSSTINVVSGVDFGWSNASQPWLTLDSTSTGDNWTAQGAGISVGESGKKGSAAIHMTYNGDGSGYLGMGTVTDTAGTGGRPTWGHFDFTYNSNAVKVGGRLYPGVAGTGATVQSTSYIEDASGGNYGSINVAGVTGTSGSWAGYAVNNRLVLMNANSTTGGLYNDNNNHWLCQYTENAEFGLYHAGGEKLRTQSNTATGNTSGAEVVNHDGTWADVGFNIMSVESEDSSVTLSAHHAGGVILKDQTTAFTVTCEASGSLDFPPGSVVTIINAQTSGNITIADGSQILYLLDGSTRTDVGANCTLAPGGVATLWREATNPGQP
jgi:hypothetical protein